MVWLVGTECAYGSAVDVLSAVGHFLSANHVAEELSGSFDTLVSRFLAAVGDQIEFGFGKREVLSGIRLDEALRDQSHPL